MENLASPNVAVANFDEVAPTKAGSSDFNALMEKALAEADDDDYLHSAWADTKALKNSLQGISGGMRAPGIR